jgi:hypothetical protein
MKSRTIIARGEKDKLPILSNRREILGDSVLVRGDEMWHKYPFINTWEIYDRVRSLSGQTVNSANKLVGTDVAVENRIRFTREIN